MEPVNWFLWSQAWLNCVMLERTERVPDKPVAWLLSQSKAIGEMAREDGKLPVKLL